MLIGVDLDDVLVDLITAFTQFHNDFYRTALTKEDWISYATWQIVGGTHRDDIRKLSEFQRTHYFRSMEPVSGAVSGINALSRNHDLIIITSRPEEMAHDTFKWLDKYFPSKFKEVHFAQNHHSSELNKKKKSEIASELEIAFLIEDNLDYAVDCAASSVKVLLFNQPWNQSSKLPKGVSRVYSWSEITKRISNMDNF